MSTYLNSLEKRMLQSLNLISQMSTYLKSHVVIPEELGKRILHSLNLTPQMSTYLKSHVVIPEGLGKRVWRQGKTISRIFLLLIFFFAQKQDFLGYCQACRVLFLPLYWYEIVSSIIFPGGVTMLLPGSPSSCFQKPYWLEILVPNRVHMVEL